MPMQYQSLGRSPLQISRIGFGCMSLKPGTGATVSLLRQAMEAGINYFDTADLYDKGLNEELVGTALGPKRKEVIIATKVGNQWRSDGSGWDWNPHKNYILKAVEQSLSRLKTDYIDLYQLHGGTIQDPVDETVEAFEQLVQAGKIRYYGISSIRPNVIREWVTRSNLTSVMVQFSLLDRRPAETILPLLQEKNIGVLTRGSLAQGLLVDKPSKEYLQYAAEEVGRARASVHSLSTPERNPVQTALQYVLSHPAVSSAVVGMRTQEQLEDAIKAFEHPLSPHEVRLLEQALPPQFYQEHR